jgi:hypothetical protein
LSHSERPGNLGPPRTAASTAVGDNETDMTYPADRVPKAHRNRLHRLKNAYRKAYRREPELDRPVTEEAALDAITFLEGELRRAGVALPEELTPRTPGSNKRPRN